MSAHAQYASYAYAVAEGTASPNDIRTMVSYIKEESQCNCLPCKVVTTMCITCNSPDDYIINMTKEMSEGHVWGLEDAETED